MFLELVIMYAIYFWNLRKMVVSTITGHLITCMKLGFPITLKDFKVSNKVRDEIINVVKTLSPEGKFIPKCFSSK